LEGHVVEYVASLGFIIKADVVRQVVQRGLVVLGLVARDKKPGAFDEDRAAEARPLIGEADPVDLCVNLRQLPGRIERPGQPGVYLLRLAKVVGPCGLGSQVLERAGAVLDVVIAFEFGLYSPDSADESEFAARRGQRLK
jgi:hypothetical protein